MFLYKGKVMRTISARALLALSIDDLWNTLTGAFKIQFDNGEIIETNAKETCYSNYGWEFHRRYPKTPLLPQHHIRTIIKDGRLSSDTHLILFGSCMWSVYDAYISEIDQMGYTEANWRDMLAEGIYREVNFQYNDLTTRLEEHTISL